MTDFRIEHLPFDPGALKSWVDPEGRHANWPVVYTLSNQREIYIGETLNAVVRMRQHLDSPDKQRHRLQAMRIVIDERFNKSACLDLESYLIRLFAADGQFKVLNRNEGITDSDYYDRRRYRESFDQIFEELREQGMFTRDRVHIENSDFFKLSPFKALNDDQAIAVEDILEGLFEDLEHDRQSTIVVQGDPGTGKTIVGIFLMKLLRDIQVANPHDKPDADSLFSDFFAEGYPDLLRGFKIGLVVPQQSLRKSIQNVFKKTPALGADLVLTPFEIGGSDEHFDLLIVDEAHRLNQRANQPSGPLNKQFAENNVKLFGKDDLAKTQLDWIRAKSTHQVFLLDAAQSVRPADLPAPVLDALIDETRGSHRFYPLASQMRVLAGADYLDFIRKILQASPVQARVFEGYELRLFDDVGEMHDAIRDRDKEFGLARLAAGYAWPYRSKSDPNAIDIELDGRRLRWNSTQVDWINTPGSLDEVGSIHTVQGYDLNYAGVIIGPELRYDAYAGRMYIDRDSYYDKKGKENNPKLGIEYSDEDLLRFITNIYGVLLSRGMRGTFVYACDPALREYLRRFVPSSTA
ncbi:DNA/RNA helicase domain-containing protein [Agromyces mangrovi Wang et al. 2018]|uniref:DNA/RNA helicase domain-containing protein n=1 Tax=Agromyces mangrovi TaxID=1858653 RepID=UPI002572B244|nr:DNA/RNA helicase domain-containing protein [Agromyces mangrovi]BDZ64113.1 hypothetical protein GCM10025877_10510 [Agromyces mangrovi]